MERNKIKESRIDDINKRLWVNRYGDPKSITSEAQKNLSAAKKIDYAKGIAYARLILATIDFLQSKNDSASKYINEALQWFSRNKPEKAQQLHPEMLSHTDSGQPLRIGQAGNSFIP